MQRCVCRTTGRCALQRGLPARRKWPHFFCRISSWTVWPESRFCCSVRTVYQRGWAAGYQDSDHLCDRRWDQRRRDGSYQGTLHQPGGFQRDRTWKTGDTGYEIRGTCRCKDFWRIQRYAGSGTERVIQFSWTCYDIQGFPAHPELFQRGGTQRSIYDRDPCSGYLLVWPLPSYYILNRTYRSILRWWRLQKADGRYL